MGVNLYMFLFDQQIFADNNRQKKEIFSFQRVNLFQFTLLVVIFDKKDPANK